VDYVYVNKNHRVLDPRSLDYMNQSRYFRMMADVNGLVHDPLVPFVVPSNVSCFRVIDKGKAMLFCLNYSSVITKPEISVTTTPLVCRSS
jgi:hypothetical protein